MDLRNKSGLVPFLFCILVITLQVVCGTDVNISSTESTDSVESWSGGHTDSVVSTTTSDNEADQDMKTINTDPTATLVTDSNTESYVMNDWYENPESNLTLDECKKKNLPLFRTSLLHNGKRIRRLHVLSTSAAASDTDIRNGWKHTLHHHASQQKTSKNFHRINSHTDGVAGHRSDDYRYDRHLEFNYRKLFFYQRTFASQVSAASSPSAVRSDALHADSGASAGTISSNRLQAHL